MEELATKALTPETMVWKEGMAAWQALKDVPELASLMPKVPPPPPPVPTPPPPPPAPTPPSPPPVQAAAPQPTPITTGDGNTLESGTSEMPNILDNELTQDAKDVFSNMSLSTEGVFDVKSSTFSTNRATVMAILGGGLFFIGTFFNSAFGFGALLSLLLFIAVPFAATGFTWLEMKKLLILNGGKQGGSYFNWAGLLMLGAAGFMAILALILGFANPFSLLSWYSSIEIIMGLAGLCLLGAAVFLILAGTKVINYKAKYFKEFAYTLFGGFPLAILFFYLARNGSGGFILRFLGAILYMAPLLFAILIFQRAGRNNNQVS